MLLSCEQAQIPSTFNARYHLKVLCFVF